MNQHHDILRELKEFEARMGISAATVCRRATKNPRMYERLVRRIEQTEEQVAEIRATMAEIEAERAGAA